MARTSQPSHSFSSIFFAYVQLIRPLNAVMSAIGVYLGYALSTQTILFNGAIAYAMLAVMCISGAGQVINDFFDYEIDKKKKSTRALASGKISRTNGFIFSMTLFVLGILLASFLNDAAFWMAVFFSALLFLYSASMSGIKFVGNALVALSVGFTFIFGASVNAITPLVLMIAFSAFLANWAREIMKDVEDKHADAGVKLTLPLLLSPARTSFIILTLLFFTILSGYLPTIFGKANAFYSILVSGANVVFILAGKKILANHAKEAQSMMKKAMLVALVAAASLLV